MTKIIFALWLLKVLDGYPTFVRKCIETARHLEEARTIEPPGPVVGSLDNFTVWEKWSEKKMDGVAERSNVVAK